MKIRRDNYEEYFIDYLDGNLSDAQIHEFETFLLQNPDLKDEIEGLEKIVVNPSDENYLLKDNLKQIDISVPVTESNFEFFCIAEAEGDLNSEQIKLLDNFILKHPEKKKEREVILKLKLNPQKEIIFQNKKSLKRTVFIIQRPLVYRALAFAASIALLMIFYFNFVEKDLEQSFVSENKESTEAKDTTSIVRPVEKAENAEASEEPVKKQIIPAAKEKVKKAANTISFKVGIPIASVTEENPENVTPVVNPQELISKVDIDPTAFRTHATQSELVSEQIDPSRIALPPVKQSANSDDYQTIDKFVLTKFSELVFKEREANVSGWGIASAGVEKINDLTGAKMKLEASAETEGKPRKLSFNSRLLSFSTPINRED